MKQGLVLGLMAWLCLSGAARDSEAGYGDAQRYPYLCNPSTSTHDAGEPSQWPGTDCCTKSFGPTGANWSCSNVGAATNWRNIVLLIGDDQAYCQFGFMAGVCSKPLDGKWVSCTSELDCRRSCVAHGLGGNRVCATTVTGTPQTCTSDAGCASAPDLGSCVGTADLGTCSGSVQSCAHHSECPSGQTCNKAAPPAPPAFPKVPLRLNEHACRNRQPQRRETDEPYCGTSTLDKKHLLFDRARAPCDNTPIEARPPLVTPHLDELAAEGVVFPRAYVPGIRCKNSRRGMMHGRYQRHLQYLFENTGQGQHECTRSASNLANLGRGCSPGDGSSECTGVDCDDAYALGRWAKEARTTGTPQKPPLEPDMLCQGQAGTKTCVGTATACRDGIEGENDCPGAYVSYAFAKTENMAPGQGGFDDIWSDASKGIGHVKCSNLTAAAKDACLDALDDGGADALPTTGDLEYGDRPHFKNPHLAAFFDVQGESLYKITQAIDGRVPAPPQGGPVIVKVVPPTGPDYWVQRRPFFIWFGIFIPHVGPTPDGVLEALYDPAPSDGSPPYHKEEFQHYARVSWLDAVTGGLRYHLKRSCVCGANGQVQSLYDNTVIIFLTDHGFLPLDSKGFTTEDGQRVPLVISAPEDRGAALPLNQRVFWDEVPNAIDLLPTIIEYSQSGNGLDRRWFPGVSANLDEDYPHARRLRALITARRQGSVSADRRNLIFGENSTPNAQTNNTPNSGMPRYVLSRPGLFGVCQTAFDNAGKKHVHPCLADQDCNTHSPSLGKCVCPPGSSSWCSGTGTDGQWMRCVNRPWKRCAGDGQCVDFAFGVNLDCSGGSCQTRLGSYKDFAGKSCTVGQGPQCFPPGVCAPLVLKAVADTADPNTGEATVTRLYDLGWNPDELNQDETGEALELKTRLGPLYMAQAGLLVGERMLTRLTKCIDAFAKIVDRIQDGKAETWSEKAALPKDCPPPLGNWYRPASGGNLWWDAP